MKIYTLQIAKMEFKARFVCPKSNSLNESKNHLLLEFLKNELHFLYVAINAKIAEVREKFQEIKEFPNNFNFEKEYQINFNECLLDLYFDYDQFHEFRNKIEILSRSYSFQNFQIDIKSLSEFFSHNFKIKL